MISSLAQSLAALKARDFFHAQQEIATTSLPILTDPTQATIKRVLESPMEARNAKIALGLYEKEVLADHEYNSTERTQFTQAYYRALPWVALTK